MHTFQGQGVFRFKYIAEIAPGAVLEVVTNNRNSVNGTATFKVLQGSLDIQGLRYPIWKIDEHGNYLYDENGNKIIDTEKTQHVATDFCLVEITEVAHNLNCAMGSIEVTGLSKIYSYNINPKRILAERELSNHTITATSVDTDNLNINLSTTHSWINIIEKPTDVTIREWQNLSLPENHLLPRRGIVKATVTAESDMYGTITLGTEDIEIIQNGFEFKCNPSIRRTSGKAGLTAWGLSPTGVDIISKTFSCTLPLNAKFLSDRSLKHDSFAPWPLWQTYYSSGILYRYILLEFEAESEDSYDITTGATTFMASLIIEQKLTDCPGVSDGALVPVAADDPKPPSYYLESTGEVFIFNEDTQTYENSGIDIGEYDVGGSESGGSRTGTVTWTCEDGTKAVLTVTQEGDSQ